MTEAAGVLRVGSMLPSLAERLDASYGAVAVPPDDAAAFLDEHGRGVRVLVVSFGHPVGRELLDRLPDLGAVVNFGVGYDNIDVGAAEERAQSDRGGFMAAEGACGPVPEAALIGRQKGEKVLGPRQLIFHIATQHIEDRHVVPRKDAALAEPGEVPRFLG